MTVAAFAPTWPTRLRARRGFVVLVAFTALVAGAAFTALLAFAALVTFTALVTVRVAAFAAS